jgi:hypothetical protein
MKIDGRCHCGRITFEAEVDPATVTICPGASCRFLEGAAATTLGLSDRGTDLRSDLQGETLRPQTAYHDVR